MKNQNQFKSNNNSSKIGEKIDQMLKKQKWTIGEEEETPAKVVGVKEVIKDTLGVWGKCFLAGCAVVSACKLVRDAMKADDAFQKKYGVI